MYRNISDVGHSFTEDTPSYASFYFISSVSPRPPSVQVSTARLWDMSKPLFLALFGLCFGLLSAFPTQEERGGKNWVVLVAGSNGWYNYRHQVRHPGAAGLHQRVPATWRLGTCSPAIVPSDTHYLDGHCRGSPPGETPSSSLSLCPLSFHPFPRPMCAMPTRSSTRTASQTSRLWSWCMMTWPRTRSGFSFISPTRQCHTP